MCQFPINVIFRSCFRSNLLIQMPTKYFLKSFFFNSVCHYYDFYILQIKDCSFAILESFQRITQKMLIGIGFHIYIIYTSKSYIHRNDIELRKKNNRINITTLLKSILHIKYYKTLRFFCCCHEKIYQFTKRFYRRTRDNIFLCHHG